VGLGKDRDFVFFWNRMLGGSSVISWTKVIGWSLCWFWLSSAYMRIDEESGVGVLPKREGGNY